MHDQQLLKNLTSREYVDLQPLKLKAGSTLGGGGRQEQEVLRPPQEVVRAGPVWT
jgi:hypothetical protein